MGVVGGRELPLPPRVQPNNYKELPTRRSIQITELATATQGPRHTEKYNSQEAVRGRAPETRSRRPRGMLGVVVPDSGRSEPRAGLREPTASHLEIAHDGGAQRTEEPRPQNHLVRPLSDAPVPELVVTENADPGSWEEREVGRRHGTHPRRGRAVG